MKPEFESKSELGKELELGALLAGISQFLCQVRPGCEIKQMDEQVAEVITPEEYQRYALYKQFSLAELGALNQVAGPNAVLGSAIERGFIVGYWLAMQHQKGE